MYLCVDKNDNNYTVLDTKDNVQESFSQDIIESYLNQGVEILGVTLDSLSLCDRTIVLVDIPSRFVRTGQVFNGYYFESYDEESYSDFHNSYLYSIIPFDTYEGLVDIFKYVQLANSSVFDKILSSYSNSKLGYNLLDKFDNGMFNVTDLDSSNVYGFSYCDVCQTLVNEGLSVGGLSNITQDCITVDGTNFSILDALKYYTNEQVSADFYCESVNCGSTCVDSVNVTTAGVSDFIKKYGDKYLSVSRFPIVNLLDYIQNTKVLDSRLENMFDIYKCSDSYLGRKGNRFIFGSIVVHDNVAISLHNMFKLSNPKFYDDVEYYIKFKKAKEKLLSGDVDEEVREPAFRINNSYMNSSDGKYKSTLTKISKDTYYDGYETSFGSMLSATYVRDNEYLDSFDGIDLFSITKCGGYYYRVGRGGVTKYLSYNNTKNMAKRIARSSIIDYFDMYRDDLGYYYNRPNILPLFVHNIVEHDDGVEINILVAVNTNDYKSFVPKEKSKDKNAGWGMTLLVVPLLLTGTRHYINGDFVIFDMLFQELAISKNLYNNLLVDIDEFNDLISIDNCSETTSAKLCNCSIGNPKNNSKSVEAYKRIIKRYMMKFNNHIDSYSYFE